jgi:hypothetical protein
MLHRLEPKTLFFLLRIFFWDHFDYINVRYKNGRLILNIDHFFLDMSKGTVVLFISKCKGEFMVRATMTLRYI